MILNKMVSMLFLQDVSTVLRCSKGRSKALKEPFRHPKKAVLTNAPADFSLLYKSVSFSLGKPFKMSEQSLLFNILIKTI